MTVSMTRKEAEEKLVGKISKVDGERFIAALKALGLLHIQEEAQIELTKTLYQQHFNDTWGTISLIMRNDVLELWIGGKFRYKCVRKDV